MNMETYLSLKAFRIRSTSISRWKAVASLFRSLSMSSAEGASGFDEVLGLGVEEEASDIARESTARSELTWGKTRTVAK